MVTNPHIQTATKVLDVEKLAIENLYQYLNEDFTQACTAILKCTGRVIVIGMGKSGHIGNKIAATLASTGTPSFFVHPGEASHGDLGMITSEDVVISISNSGETQEVLTIVPVIKRIGATMISMTGNETSSLAKLSEIHICIKVEQEACPLGLAPTASTTATLVMGDALAVSLLEARGFTEDDFALSHPGGSLGKRLLLRLSDIMHSGNQTPIVSEQTTIKDALLEVSQKGLGMTAVVNDSGELSGLFTDGDLRRILDKKIDIHDTPISHVMTKGGVTATADMLAAQALKLMQDKKINGLFIVNQDNQPIGAMNMQDLLASGVL